MTKALKDELTQAWTDSTLFFSLEDTFYSDVASRDIDVTYQCKLENPSALVERLDEDTLTTLAGVVGKDSQAEVVADYLQEHMFDKDEDGKPERLANWGVVVVDYTA